MKNAISTSILSIATVAAVAGAFACAANATDERECTRSVEKASAELLEKHCSGQDIKPHVFYIKELSRPHQPAFLSCTLKEVYHTCGDLCGWLEKMMNQSQNAIADGILDPDEDHRRTLKETGAAYKDFCRPAVSGRFTPMWQVALR